LDPSLGSQPETPEDTQRSFGGARSPLPKSAPDGFTDFLALKDPRFSRLLFAGPDHPPGTFTDDTR
jgi:hypothetical protein